MLYRNTEKGEHAMCCRYYIEPNDVVIEKLAEGIKQMPLRERFYQKVAKPIKTGGEIFPDDIVPVIAKSKRGNKACFPMQWGYHVNNRPLLPNARMETAAIKPLFQTSWNDRRCIIPASWYYEWEHFLRNDGKRTSGDKYLIQPQGEQYTWLCGLYRMEDTLPHFVILTKEPSDDIKFIHDRMPLMIQEKDIDEWLSPDGNPKEIAARAMTQMHCEKV